ncbi:early nodulin-like protein 14 [Tasmannia lanceolata]|uniref:early nodulin-like protein 14 n=1 Tax=Tasmannia lanceolata TaxID=3420 RepID=UPI004063D009
MSTALTLTQQEEMPTQLKECQPNLRRNRVQPVRFGLSPAQVAFLLKRKKKRTDWLFGFTYSAALESIAELKNREEYESCDVSNPIRMYTDGLDKVLLDAEGTRYFASTKLDKCKDGLKLHVDVIPQGADDPAKPTIVHVVATGPTPSGSAPLQGVSFMLWLVLALLCLVGFWRV